MQNIHDRIKGLRESKGLTQQDVADRLGVSRVAVTKWESGQTANLKLANLIAICDLLNVDPTSLITGKRLNGFRLPPATPVSRFDVFDVRASCGTGAINADYPEIVHCIEMPVEVAHQLIGRTNADTVKIIRATHDSMIPAIYPDDLLFIDVTVTEFRSEGIYLILHAGELICKRLAYLGKALTVISDNDRYPPWLWDERMQETRIIGRVLRALPMEMKNFGE
jgi:DNA-binding XRE family transcriptional regulator